MNAPAPASPVTVADLIADFLYRTVPFGGEGTPMYTHRERTSQPMIRLASGDLTSWELTPNRAVAPTRDSPAASTAASAKCCTSAAKASIPPRSTARCVAFASTEASAASS